MTERNPLRLPEGKDKLKTLAKFVLKEDAISLNDTVVEFKMLTIQMALTKAETKVEAARLLGITRQGMNSYVQKYGGG